MSSEPLLAARGVFKAYSMSLSPREKFFEAVLGWKAAKPERVVLRDIDIDVHRGETVGILGRNGAGKTTLLGILGNVIEPTRGEVVRNGKIAVLLAVGAGFNPQFTGRENAELFCSLMGFSRVEIAERMPDIKAFADLDEYFEMPLRTYSSGMMARLGFSCAIHVDADLIIIDETLAVGDASFRVKCYERIKAMQARGQTFLLVSHSPNLVANFCSRTIVIERGAKVFDGSPLDGLNVYKDIRESLAAGKKLTAVSDVNALKAPKLSLDTIRFSATTGSDTSRCKLSCELVAQDRVDEPIVSFGIRNQEGIVVCSYDSAQDVGAIRGLQPGERQPLILEFTNRLLAGQYFISARVAERVGDVTTTLGTHHNIARFDVGARGKKSAGIVDLNMTVRTSPEMVPCPLSETP